VLGHLVSLPQEDLSETQVMSGHLMGEEAGQACWIRHKERSPTQDPSEQRNGLYPGHLNEGEQLDCDVVQDPSAHLNGDTIGHPLSKVQSVILDLHVLSGH